MRSTDSDSELMVRYQEDRDSALFERLFIQHKDALLRYILRIVRDRATAEDASQRTWLKVIEVAKRGTYTAHPNATFRTWLFTLARNHMVDEQRRKLALSSRAAAIDGALFEMDVNISSASIDPADQALKCDLAERINSALKLLPSAQREVITLWANGFDPHEISTITRAPRETVLSRKKYALAKLRSSALADACPSPLTADPHPKCRKPATQTRC